MDAEGRLTRRAEKTVAPFVYAGVAIMRPTPFAAMQEPVFPLAPFFFEAAKHGRLFGMRLDGRWLHVGTPDAIDEAERAIADSAR
jgi:MurNAc alpha-1-phosphate uridylyltransferase